MKTSLFSYIERARASIERGRRFITHDIWRIGLPGEQVPNGFIIKQIRAVILLARGVIEETLLLRASALTFATLLFLVPFFALMFSLIQTFNLGDQIYERMDEHLTRAVETVRRLGDESAPGVLEDEAPPPDTDSTPYLETSVAPFEGESPPDMESDELLKQQLIGWVFPIFAEGQGITDDPSYENPVKLLMSLAEEGAKSPRAIGISGLLFILSTVFGFMRNVESTFNRIWGVHRRRNFFRVISDYMMITLLLPFVAASIMGISAALESRYIAEMLGPFSIALRGSQIIILCIVFTLVYMYVPNTKVYFRYALLGGIVGAALYALNSWAYVKFQFGLARYTPFFSTFALFPLLLMYIYFSWLILLFGSLVSFAYQNEKTFAMEWLSERATVAYRETLAVRIMVELARRFKRGMFPLTVKEIAERWNVPTRLLSDTLECLMDAKLVAACATTPVCYQPARAPNTIAILEVVNAVRESGQDPSLLRKDNAYRSLDAGLNTADPNIMHTDVEALAEQITDADGKEQ